MKLSWNQVKDLLEAVGFLAIVASLILVAFELRQNTQATIASSSEGIANQSLDYFALGINSEIVAKARYKQSTDQPLSGLEQDQLWWHQYYNFRVFENVFLQFRRGYIERDEWGKYGRIIKFRLSEDEFARRMWAETEYAWTEDFRNEVSRLLRETG